MPFEHMVSCFSPSTVDLGSPFGQEINSEVSEHRHLVSKTEMTRIWSLAVRTESSKGQHGGCPLLLSLLTLDKLMRDLFSRVKQ